MRAAALKKRMIEKRKAALFKKAEELSVLCGSEIGIVIISPTERDPIVWPAVEATTKRFLAFMDVPEEERVKRMVLHEEYMRGRVNEEIGKMRRMEEEVERKEMNALMMEVIAGRKSLTEMDARQLKGLYALADDKMAELEKRKQDLLAVQNDGGGTARPPPRRRNRRERNHRAAAPDAGGSDGGGSYYVPQPPPAPLFDARWTTPPAPAGELPSIVDPATWFIPNMVALPPPQGEGSYQQMLFSAAAGGGSLPTNNGGGNSASAACQVTSSNQDLLYNFFPWSI